MTTINPSPTPNLHITFLLDRSGSMESIATDVIGGFNRFLADQKGEGNDAAMTLVQFDSQNDHEVLTDGLPIAEVNQLSAATFQPRGSTPLFDAIGKVLDRATKRVDHRAKANLPAEEQLVVLFTDGEENVSCTYTATAIKALIKAKEDLGWSFMFLGANQDAFASGERLGVSRGNISNFMADDIGSARAFSDLSDAVKSKRSNMRNRVAYSKAELFTERTAEEDFQRRSE